MRPETLDVVIEAAWFYLFSSTLSLLFHSALALLLHSLDMPVAALALFIFGCYCCGLAALRQRKPSLTSLAAWGNQVAVVTGGANGIGRGLVDLLREKGATVIVLDRMDPNIPDVEFYQCDVSNLQQVNHVAADIIKKTGHPTMLVNNAGIVVGKKMADASVEELERTIKINVLGHFYLIKAFLPGFMKQRGGHILAVASVMGLTGAAFATDYCASKFAVTGYMESLRQELNP
ncbi:hypothetical protein HDU91_004940 [Kappamyces sp. JEL0680]|nr:hypothetical protein HDU91_004940 [Kappamyces sp. JEL0680]